MLRTYVPPIPDDTEEAPWMVMGMPRSVAAANFYVVLRDYVRTLERPLLVAAMLPIRFRSEPPGDRGGSELLQTISTV